MDDFFGTAFSPSDIFTREAVLAEKRAEASRLEDKQAVKAAAGLRIEGNDEAQRSAGAGLWLALVLPGVGGEVVAVLELIEMARD